MMYNKKLMVNKKNKIIKNYTKMKKLKSTNNKELI
jgi:hypothetical protein